MILDWSNKIVNIQKSDMLQIQTTPVVIYQLDLFDFHNNLHLIQESADGIVNEDIHSHVPPKSVSGVILARVVEIVNDYTITFEDGLYNVNIVGGNSNVSDRVNKNQVGVNTANSAGLQDLTSLQSASFSGDAVALRQGDGDSGTTYPIGTRGKPVDNWVDARAIVNARNLSSVLVLGTAMLNAGDDVSGLKIIGSNPLTSILVVSADAITDNVIVTDIYFTGSLDGGSTLKDCVIGEVAYFDGFIRECALAGDVIYVNGSATLFDCAEAAKVTNKPVADMTNGDNLFVRRYSGDLIVKNKTTVGIIEIQITGELTIDSTCTDGTFRIFGDGYVINNSGLTIEDRTTGSPDEISDKVWGATTRSLTEASTSSLTQEQHDKLMESASKTDVIIASQL